MDSRGSRAEAAAALMARFAERTGLAPIAEGRRYLWTDAFAVCNYISLARSTGDAHAGELALELVDRVHHALGRHRHDDRRHGRISGLGELEGDAHPTLGGLRIGKDLPERTRHEPFDESLEWDRDGQYFHYLTKWMHALDQASRFAGRPELNVWARELARVAHGAFCYGLPGDRRRMYWKMSIDLTHPQVRTMGQHDPLDGYITCLQLEATASALGAPNGPDLDAEVADFASMLPGLNLATVDALGIGGLLVDAYRTAQIGPRGPLPRDALVDSLLGAAVAGLEQYAHLRELHEPAEHRLAFRELGLAIGLHAATLLRDDTEAGARPGRRAWLDALRRHDHLRTEIEAFWVEPAHQRVPSWEEHLDINEVMLATSLMPTGFLRLEPAPKL